MTSDYGRMLVVRNKNKPPYVRSDTRLNDDNPSPCPVHRAEVDAILISNVRRLVECNATMSNASLAFWIDKEKTCNIGQER